MAAAISFRLKEGPADLFQREMHSIAKHQPDADQPYPDRDDPQQSLGAFEKVAGGENDQIGQPEGERQPHYGARPHALLIR